MNSKWTIQKPIGPPLKRSAGLFLVWYFLYFGIGYNRPYHCPTSTHTTVMTTHLYRILCQSKNKKIPDYRLNQHSSLLFCMWHNVVQLIIKLVRMPQHQIVYSHLVKPLKDKLCQSLLEKNQKIPHFDNIVIFLH
jgi:hypothetical protein